MDLRSFSVNRREKVIFNGVLNLLDTVAACVDSFEGSIAALAKGDTEGAEGLVRKVFEEETRADAIHRELSLKVAEGAFFGGVREDILNLLEKIDDIADSAKDAARFLAADSRMGEEAREILGSANMKLFLGDLKASVGALTGLVRALDVSKKDALTKVHSVEEFEEDADSHKDALIKELFAQSKSMDSVSVIQLRDFIFVADDIADNAEDAGDVIIVLIAKGYG